MMVQGYSWYGAALVFRRAEKYRIKIKQPVSANRQQTALHPDQFIIGADIDG